MFSFTSIFGFLAVTSIFAYCGDSTVIDVIFRFMASFIIYSLIAYFIEKF